MNASDLSAESLWKNYVFLTSEMLKFVSTRDMNMFYSLLDQRAGIQPLLEAAADDGFRQSLAGQELLRQLPLLNRAIADRLKLVYNQACRQLEVSQSYEGQARGTGARIDFQR